jgi:MSHA biogenesis protein MshL
MNYGIDAMHINRNIMLILWTTLTGTLSVGCQLLPTLPSENMPEITAALDESMHTVPDDSVITPPPEVTDALLPPLRDELPDILPDLEPRFDISVNNSRAREFFMSLVKGTTLNMVVHPDVTGTISITLRDVTIEDVLSTTRDVYGYRYQRNGNTYQVYPARIRTQIFTVDYLHAVRNGGSRTTVSSGRISDAGNGGDNGSSGTSANATGGSTSGSVVSGSMVSTESASDFWSDLKESLKMIIGDEGGRKVMVHPQSGVIVVHALPEELRNVEEFLHTIENAAHRLVILEAKIIEVTLNDKFQAGINWNALFEFGDDKSILFGHAGGGSVFDTGASSLAGSTVPLVRGTQVTGFDTTAFGGIFTIDANLKDFNALIELLKTQGDVQVLSSPRISTVNNQKAVIKVGQDEFFVTDVETETDTVSSTVSNTSVDVTLTPFFSGVALDVIPQISDDKSVILHIHPAISEVTEKVKDISTSTTDVLSIPLALSTIRETDTVIRAQSGQVVVLGGLMKNAMRDEESRTPFLGDVPVVGDMFRHNRSVASKSELVILLRPIVIDSNRQWNGQLRSTADRFRNLRPVNPPDGQPQIP